MAKNNQSAKITDFAPDPNNANKGTERGRGMLERSLTHLGLGRSILVDKHNVIIAGNKTLETAAENGFDDAVVVETTGDKLVVVRRTDLDLSTDEKAKQLAIADNRVGEISLSWDAEVLLELEETVDLSNYFSDIELQNILDQDELEADAPTLEEDEEAIADLQEKADNGEIESRVKLGEVWKLGRHYIACADCTVEENVKGLLNFVSDRNPNMVWADAPYGINIVAANGAKAFGSNKVRGSIGSSNLAETGKYAPVIGDESTKTAELSTELYLRLFPKSIQCWWGANHFLHCFPPSPCWIVWDKENMGNHFADAELAWVNQPTAVRIFRHMWNGLMKASERGQKRVHPTQKPVALFNWFAEKYGESDDLVFDPFLGSGISIVGCQELEGDRVCVGFELSPEYCEVICRRFEALTGVNAKLAGHL